MSFRQFFGKGDAIIRALTDTKINGETVAAGEIITTFSDVSIALEYKVDHKMAGVNPVNLLSTTKHAPFALIIAGIENSESVEKLFFDKTKTQMSTYPQVKHGVIGSGLFIQGNPTKVEVLYKDKVIPSTIQDGILKVTEHADEEVAIISYHESEVIERGAARVRLGYVSIETVVEGYLADTKTTLVLTSPRNDLISEPATELTAEPQYDTGLTFVIVGGEYKLTQVM